jgi:hypothetical protein
MSALGQEQTSRGQALMSALPLKADVAQRGCDVRFVPKADIRQSASQRCPRWHGRVRKRAQRIARRPLRQETTWNFLIKNLPPPPNTVSRFHARRDLAMEFGK